MPHYLRVISLTCGTLLAEMTDSPKTIAMEPPVTLSLPLDQALALAEQHQQAGRLQAAEAVCREILRARPNCAPALHVLGLIAYQAGNLSAAIEFVSRAAAAEKTIALYHCNLGEMHRQAGQLDAALAEGRRAIELDPNMSQAL